MDNIQKFDFTGFDFDKFLKESLDVAKMREANGGIKLDTFSLLKHCATEVVEASQAYSKLSLEAYDIENEDDFKKELGDIMCCALLICANLGYNVPDILSTCYLKNKARAEKHGDKL